MARRTRQVSMADIQRMKRTIRNWANKLEQEVEDLKEERKLHPPQVGTVILFRKFGKTKNPNDGYLYAAINVRPDLGQGAWYITGKTQPTKYDGDIGIPSMPGSRSVTTRHHLTWDELVEFIGEAEIQVATGWEIFRPPVAVRTPE